MKLENNLKVFAFRLRGDFNVRILNCNKEFKSIIDQLSNSTKNYMNLNYLLNLDYSLLTFEGMVKDQLIVVNLYFNEEMKVSLIEIQDNHNFSLEDIRASKLFFDNLPLLTNVGIHDKLIMQRMMSFLD